MLQLELVGARRGEAAQLHLLRAPVGDVVEHALRANERLDRVGVEG